MKQAAIQRHKTAIRRGDFSRPVKCLLRDGLLGKETSFLDYGCGRGEDLELLTADGFTCNGWDPVFQPKLPPAEADIVNLGYVINVIEDPEERAETIRRAWGLCRQVMAVAAQVLMAGRGKEPVEFGDGVLTNRGTFQKFFEQSELKSYLEAQLQQEAIPAGIGTFYVFKDEVRRQQFLANRYRRREILPRRRIAELRLEEARQALEPLMEVIAALGRLPDPTEFDGIQAVIERYGSLKRAFAVIQRITDAESWEAIARRRREDMLVYLALSRFRKRPLLSHLPLETVHSVTVNVQIIGQKFSNGRPLAGIVHGGGIAGLEKQSIGFRTGLAVSAEERLHVPLEPEPLLRIYEGCGRTYLGDVEGANIIKIHRRSGKLSYLVYPEFENDPHPALLRCVRLNLRTRQIECYDYASNANPPVLHRKETFLTSDDLRRDKFARLTTQEEKQGLLEDSSSIGTRNGWQRRLNERGFALKGHRLVRSNGNPSSATEPKWE